MEIEELIQLMRTCSLAKIRAELEATKETHTKFPDRRINTVSDYDIIVLFYQRAAVRK